MSMNIRSDRTLIRTAGGSRRYALVKLTAPTAPPREGRVPANISFVLDRSGSMHGDRKFELVREAVDKALGLLQEGDRFSVVVYDDRIHLLMESTPASAEAKQTARRKLERISPRGSTDLGGGWLRGCEQAALYGNDSVPAKCLLLTDGLANVGITDGDELGRHAAELRKRGVLTSTFGVGSDFDEVLLQKMANGGGGHSYYVQKALQIPDFLTSELGETLEVAARGASLRLSLPPDVTAEPLNPYACERSGDTVAIDLGNLVSGQELALVLELRFPAGLPGGRLSVGFAFSDREGALDFPPATLDWTFADHAANDRQMRDRAVDAAVAELFAARAREKALEQNRRGDYDAARLTLNQTAARIRTYAGDDKILNGIAMSVSEAVREYGESMSSDQMKGCYYQVQYSMRDRDTEGKSKRPGK
jgi:Ca-activated chloride channel family protein